MAVKHLFLAILSKKAMHGYDLKNAFEELVSGQWTLNYGQVYTTLTRLERDGLVTSEEVIQEDKPDKKIYNLTTEGKKTLDVWMQQEIQWNVFADELSFQLTALDYVDREKAADLLTQYREQLMKLIGELVMQKAVISDHNSLMAWIMERNIMKMEADIKWAESYLQNQTMH